MSPHPLTNFEMSKYYQKEPKLNGVYSRNNFPEKQDGAYVIKFDELESLGTQWIALYVNGDNKSAFCDATYFDTFWDEHIPKEMKNNHRKQKYKKIYRTQAYISIMGGYICIGFVERQMLVRLYKFIFS